MYERLLGSGADNSHGQDRGLASSSLFESVLWPPPAQASAPALPEVLADPVVGYLAERVYEEPRSSFSFNCGEFLGGIHDQSDNGSITLFAGEVPLVIDSGAANDPVEGSPSSSHGHSVVLVDGRGQVPSGKGAGCTGRILHAERDARVTVISADLTAAYAARGHNPVRHAIRHCVFGKRPFTYLLVVDDFSRPRGERAVFEQTFHTPPVVDSQLAGGELRIAIEFAGRTRRLVIRALDRDVEIEQGAFVQHDGTLFAEHPVWRLRRAGHHVVMAALLLPYETRPPAVQADFDSDAGRVRLAWSAAGEEGVDSLQINPGFASGAVFTRDAASLAESERLFGLVDGAVDLPR